MNKKKRKKISALILLLAITVGYALLSTTLKINGIANIKSNTWDIHFENVVANNESTVTAELPSITDNATKVSYEVELSLPGDFYEFTVDAVNDGSINGIIEKIDHKVYESDGVTEATLPSYIKYSIVYDGTSTAPALGDILEAGDSKTYRVRIEFDSEATTLPSTDLTYVIVDEIKYTQTKDRNRTIEDIIDEIEDDPDSHRNPDQNQANRDIGLDEDGNVINLDLWIDEYDYKAYQKNTENENEVILGEDGLYTAATSEAQVIDGEVITPIPAYIMFAGENKFLPVTEIKWVFCNFRHQRDVEITKMPHIPNTVKTIGEAFLHSQNVQEIIIPSYIEKIDRSGFAANSISTVIFESDNNLKVINDYAFASNNLSGNLVLPRSVTFIGKEAFTNNNLTSVTFPSSAEYFTNCTSYGSSCDSFDQSTTINHQY